MEDSRPRLRRGLFGIRRSDVESALAVQQIRTEAADGRAARAEAEAELLASRLADRERELRDARRQNDAARADVSAALSALGAVAERLATLHAAAAQATGRAVAEAADTPGVEDGLGPDELRPAALDAVSEELRSLGERLGGASEELEATAALVLRRGEGPEEQPAGAGRPGATGSEAGVVRVEMGPLADFDTLARFMDAADRVAAAGRVVIERFSGGRATIVVELSEPVDLISALAAAGPVPFEVRAATTDRAVVDLEVDGATGGSRGDRRAA